jgi:drug/metabolite transporter (DMT)-like permease
MLLMAVFSMVWVLIEIGVAIRLSNRYNLMQVVWWRYGVHLATMLLLFGWRDPAYLWRTSRPGYHWLRSLLMLVMPGSYVLAIQQGVAGDTVMMVFWLSPLCIVVAARLMLGELVTARTWAACGVAGLAALSMHRPSPPASPWLLILPVLMMLSFSIYVVMTRALRFERLRANMFYTALGVFVVLTPLVPRFWTTPGPGDAAAMVLVGLFGAVALLLLDRSTSCAPVSTTASVLYLNVAAMAAIASLLSGDLPSIRIITSAGIIVAVVCAIWLHEGQRATLGHALGAAHAEGALR